MVNIFLCDDSRFALEKYSHLITLIARKHNLAVTLSTFTSGDELLFHLSDSPNMPDIIYLDILMTPTNGMLTAEKLRTLGCQAEIIFLTSTKEYVLQAFNVFPVQYLLKEATSNERFEEILLRAMAISRKKESEMFICDSGNTRKMIPLREIAYFEIWKRVIMVHYEEDRTFEFYGTMEQLEKQLANQHFIRTHRSYLVNLQYISKFHPQNLELKTGDIIPIGITHMKNVKDAFSAYVEQHNIYLPKDTGDTPLTRQAQ